MLQITEQITNLLKGFELKKLVLGRGHDCGGLIADVYYKRKQVAIYHDDGWGGEPEITFLSDEAEKTVKDYLESVNFAQIMLEGDYSFMKTVESIGFETQFCHVVEYKANLKDIEKAEKKIQRDCKGKLLYGTVNSYQQISWKGIKELKDLLRYGNGLKLLQKAYDEAKVELKNIKGGKIFNSEEQLKELGVKL